jgi:hypothetical protein
MRRKLLQLAVAVTAAAVAAAVTFFDDFERAGICISMLIHNFIFNPRGFIFPRTTSGSTVRLAI